MWAPRSTFLWALVRRLGCCAAHVGLHSVRLASTERRHHPPDAARICSEVQPHCIRRQPRPEHASPGRTTRTAKEHGCSAAPPAGISTGSARARIPDDRRGPANSLLRRTAGSLTASYSSSMSWSSMDSTTTQSSTTYSSGTSDSITVPPGGCYYVIQQVWPRGDGRARLACAALHTA